MQYRNMFFNTVVRPIFRTSSVLCPSLHELATFGPTSTDATEILAHTFGFNNKKEYNIIPYLSEFAALKEELSERQQSTKLNYPITYNIADTASLLIYLTIRALSPSVVLETGVANGVSSYYILNALNKNNKGTLYSVDIDSNVGGLLDGSDKHRWLLKIVDEENAGNEFEKLVDSFNSIDIFIHDSDHSYKAQMREYRKAYGKIGDGGILASDDVDFSYAFVDFCSKTQIKPLFLVTSAKVFGLTRKDILDKQ